MKNNGHIIVLNPFYLSEFAESLLSHCHSTSAYCAASHTFSHVVDLTVTLLYISSATTNHSHTQAHTQTHTYTLQTFQAHYFVYYV